jgi:hypothetical protein
LFIVTEEVSVTRYGYAVFSLRAKHRQDSDVHHQQAPSVGRLLSRPRCCFQSWRGAEVCKPISNKVNNKMLEQILGVQSERIFIVSSSIGSADIWAWQPVSGYFLS